MLTAEAGTSAGADSQGSAHMVLNEQSKIGIKRKGYDVGGILIARGEMSDYGGMSEEEAVRMNEELFDKLNELPVDEDG